VHLPTTPYGAKYSTYREQSHPRTANFSEFSSRVDSSAALACSENGSNVEGRPLPLERPSVLETPYPRYKERSICGT
jgi:hypothetical protein